MTKEPETFLTPTEFLTKIGSLKPGQWFKYYVGFMPMDLGGSKRQLADCAKLCEEYGIVLLTQKKIGFQRYEYRATRSTAHIKLDHEFHNRFKRLK